MKKIKKPFSKQELISAYETSSQVRFILSTTRQRHARLIWILGTVASGFISTVAACAGPQWLSLGLFLAAGGFFLGTLVIGAIHLLRSRELVLDRIANVARLPGGKEIPFDHIVGTRVCEAVPFSNVRSWNRPTLFTTDLLITDDGENPPPKDLKDPRSWWKWYQRERSARRAKDVNVAEAMRLDTHRPLAQFLAEVLGVPLWKTYECKDCNARRVEMNDRLMEVIPSPGRRLWEWLAQDKGGDENERHNKHAEKYFGPTH